ncbi:hypothetical protein BH11VER1_BH11VER1_29580 [soil metagenome]
MQEHDHHEAPPEPTRWSSLVFLAKAKAHQFLRALKNWRRPMRKYPRDETLVDAPVIVAWQCDLWREGNSPRERELQLGKVQNLRIAAQELHGVEVPANEVWSFWKHLGRTTRAKGYARGRELREGCIIPQRGGGLCQLSGAIFNAALQAGLEIVERHAHTSSSIGSLARINRDATVFWNYVDLRLQAPIPWRMEVSLSETQLTVRILCGKALPQNAMESAPSSPAGALNTCATCGINSCFRSHPLDGEQTPDRTAVLVDEWWPEWDAYLTQNKHHHRTLFLPLDGKRWKKSNYAWDTRAHDRVRPHTLLALQRALVSRRLRNEGASRQRTLIAWDEKMAQAYAHRLQAAHSHLIVTQTLLPFLWRDGWLGGRSFDVLMTRLPMSDLHDYLDEASRRQPESTTSADFRADPTLIRHETEALAAARHWVTPHRAIANLAGEKAVFLDWHLPPAPKFKQAIAAPLRVAFPASTLCRKGAYELREVALKLSLEVVALGGILEGADFWEGVRLVPRGTHWLDDVHAVVLPAFVEHAPRRLLEAVAAGVPVIASEVCGLNHLPGVTTIARGDAKALETELTKLQSHRTQSHPISG